MVRLEKLHTYNVIRVLRVVLPVVVAGLLGLGLANYWTRRPRLAERETPRLVDNVEELSEDVRFSRTESGRQVFTIEAEQNVGTQDGRSLLEGVRIRIFGQDVSSPDRLISSPYCNFEESTNDIACTGNAVVQFDDRTRIETTSLRYVNAERVVRTLAAARVVRPGEFEADAGEIVLDLEREIVSLNGAVVIRTANGTRLETESLRYLEREDRADVSGGLRLVFPEGELRGRMAAIEMKAGTLSPEFIRVTGRVTALASAESEPASIGADSLEVHLDGTRVLSMVASGAATAESGAGAERRTLSGDVLEGFFSSGGGLDSIEARGQALMRTSNAEVLRAPVIRYALAGSRVRTTGESRFETAELSIDGADFRILPNGSVEFETDRPASIRMPSGSLEADRTRAVIDADSGDVIELVQRGNARFERDSRLGSADEISSSGENLVVLTGNARVRAPGLQLEARRIELDLAAEQFQASESVQAVVADQESRILIVGDNADGGGEQIRVTGEAQVWRENLHIAADAVDFLRGERAFTATGSVRSVLGPYHVRSDRLDFNDRDGLARYSGSVEARSGEVDFNADRLDVFLSPGEVSEAASDRIERIVATGHVDVHRGSTTGRGDEAIYSRQNGTVTLRGADAEVSDPESGSARGPEFVWNVDDGHVVMTGAEGRPAVSRRRLDEPQE